MDIDKVPLACVASDLLQAGSDVVVGGPGLFWLDGCRKLESSELLAVIVTMVTGVGPSSRYALILLTSRTHPCRRLLGSGWKFTPTKMAQRFLDVIVLLVEQSSGSFAC